MRNLLSLKEGSSYVMHGFFLVTFQTFSSSLVFRQLNYRTSDMNLSWFSLFSIHSAFLVCSFMSFHQIENLLSTTSSNFLIPIVCPVFLGFWW
jgi:hypothetical protein